MPSDTRHFAAARRASRRSTCVRGNKTGAVIVHRGRLIGRGASVCSPNGEAYGEPIVSCPRKAAGAGTGERYELCSPIHAEEAAIFASTPKRRSPTPTVIIVLRNHKCPVQHARGFSVFIAYPLFPESHRYDE